MMTKEEKRIYNQQWYQEHKEEVKLRNKNWVKLNPEKKKISNKNWQKIHEVEEKKRKNTYYVLNKKELVKRQIERQKIKRKNDPYFRLCNSLRSRIRLGLFGTSKSASTQELLGATFEFVKKYLEDQFEPWMTWENHGIYTWHIDHIIPCAKFDLTNPEEQRKCFHYTNLQPLKASVNLSKSAKVNYQIPKILWIHFKSYETLSL